MKPISIVTLSTLIISLNIHHVTPSEQPIIDVPPLIKIYKGGRIERLSETERVPPSLDSKTNVESKDAFFSQSPKLLARIYLPKNTRQDEKLPLLLYFHGGAFVVSSAASPSIHNFLNLISSEAKLIAVSVDYRLAPENPLPAGYEDSWSALEWVASHSDQKGPDDWLNRHGDLKRVFVSGDSAGANIAHQIALRFGLEKLKGVKLKGLILCHPFFWGSSAIRGEGKLFDDNVAPIAVLWHVACPDCKNVDDPRLNPSLDPNLGRVGCKRVLVFVSEGDFLRERGRSYVEKLKAVGWTGEAEVVGYKGEPHDFHLGNLNSKNSIDLRHRFVAFIQKNS